MESESEMVVKRFGQKLDLLEIHLLILCFFKLRDEFKNSLVKLRINGGVNSESNSEFVI